MILPCSEFPCSLTCSCSNITYSLVLYIYLYITSHWFSRDGVNIFQIFCLFHGVNIPRWHSCWHNPYVVFWMFEAGFLVMVVGCVSWWGIGKWNSNVITRYEMIMVVIHHFSLLLQFGYFFTSFQGHWYCLWLFPSHIKSINS